MVKHLGVGGRVAARCSANRGLIDVDNFVNRFQALYRIVLTCAFPRSVDDLRQSLVQDLDEQRGLAAAAHSSNYDEFAERYVHVDILEVVLARASDRDNLSVALAPLFGYGYT